MANTETLKVISEIILQEGYEAVYQQLLESHGKEKTHEVFEQLGLSSLLPSEPLSLGGPIPHPISRARNREVIINSPNYCLLDPQGHILFHNSDLKKVEEYRDNMNLSEYPIERRVFAQNRLGYDPSFRYYDEEGKVIRHKRIDGGNPQTALGTPPVDITTFSSDVDEFGRIDHYSSQSTWEPVTYSQIEGKNFKRLKPAHESKQYARSQSTFQKRTKYKKNWGVRPQGGSTGSQFSGGSGHKRFSDEIAYKSRLFHFGKRGQSGTITYFWVLSDPFRWEAVDNNTSKVIGSIVLLGNSDGDSHPLPSFPIGDEKTTLGGHLWDSWRQMRGDKGAEAQSKDFRKSMEKGFLYDPSKCHQDYLSLFIRAKKNLTKLQGGKGNKPLWSLLNWEWKHFPERRAQIQKSFPGWAPMTPKRKEKYLAHSQACAKKQKHRSQGRIAWAKKFISSPSEEMLMVAYDQGFLTLKRVTFLKSLAPEEQVKLVKNQCLKML